MIVGKWSVLWVDNVVPFQIEHQFPPSETVIRLFPFAITFVVNYRSETVFEADVKNMYICMYIPNV